jgi:hypothetical protein
MNSCSIFWTSSMGLHNLFYFNIEVRFSSSTVIGSLSYYPIWMHISSSRTLNLNPIFFKVHSFMIHGNRSPSPWLSEFLNIKIRNPCSPLPAPRSHNSHPLVQLKEIQSQSMKDLEMPPLDSFFTMNNTILTHPNKIA